MIFTIYLGTVTLYRNAASSALAGVRHVPDQELVGCWRELDMLPFNRQVNLVEDIHIVTGFDFPCRAHLFATISFIETPAGHVHCMLLD